MHFAPIRHHSHPAAEDAGETAAFQQSLQSLIREICDAHECTGILNVSSKSLELLLESQGEAGAEVGEALVASRELGFNCLNSSVLRSPHGSECFVDCLPASGSDCLTTCFNALECIHRNQLSLALWNLRNLTGALLLASVSTRPSSQYNSHHATVMPRQAWLNLFEGLGFTLEQDPRVEAIHLLPKSSESSECWCTNHWRRIDPYRDSQTSERHYFLLRKEKQSGDELDFASFNGFAANLLGLSREPNSIKIQPATFLTFLIGHYQEFLLFKPFLEMLPVSSYRVLIRSAATDTFEQNRRQSVLTYLNSRGISYKAITDSVEKELWETEASRHHALITGIDSTANTSHLINSAILVQAKAAGIRTFQLQHGIWPHAEFKEPLTILADYLLTWSADYELPFVLNKATAETGSRENGQPTHTVEQVGCAKFDAYADPATTAIENIFGDWASGFSHSVLVATNLHWPLHAKGSEVLPQLEETARSLPDVLFVCKLHPAHDYDSRMFETMPHNVVVVDEFISLYAEMDISRLLKACDACICTLGTVALEAALACKPVAVLDTENPNSFKGIQTTEIHQLTTCVDELLNNPVAGHKEFIRHYYAPRKLQNALQTTLDVVERALSKPARFPFASELAVKALATAFLSELETNHSLLKKTQELENVLKKTSGNQPTIQEDQSAGVKSRHLKFRTPDAGLSATDQIDIGQLTNRDQFPLLLNKLGLTGLGVELGVAGGSYSRHLLEHSNLKMLFSVDRWSDHHDDQECQFACNILGQYGVRSAVLRMTFQEAVLIFADNTFDFIFLDGYAHAGQDGVGTLHAWWSKLRSGGIFAGHDYDSHWPQTVQVVNDFMVQNDLEFYATLENPAVVEHAFPSWYTRKP